MEAKDFVQMDLFSDYVEKFSTTAPIGSRWYMEPGTDGITPEDFERIHVLTNKKAKSKVSITTAQGKSGGWYFGVSLEYDTEGMGYAAWPKFSDRFDTRYAAISAAVIKTIAWYNRKKMPKGHMDLVLAGLAKFTDTLVPEEALDTELSWNDQQRAAIAIRDGVSPDCKHLSIWNKTVCPDDCDDCKSGCKPKEDPKALQG